MNVFRSNFNVLDSNLQSYHSSMFAGSHMPLRNEVKVTVDSIFGGAIVGLLIVTALAFVINIVA